MKKYLLIILVLLLTVIGAAQAVPVDELTALAAYAPADAPVFIAARTDDGYLETLNGLLNSVLVQFPEGIVPPDTDTDLFALLDQGAVQATGDPEATFQTVFRIWLGDTGALIIPSNELMMQSDSTNPTAILVENKDLEAAVAYFDMLLAGDMDRGDYEKVEQADGSIVYQPAFDYLDPYYISDEIVVIGRYDELVLDGDGATLADSDLFNDTVNALPQDDYNILSYADPTAMILAMSEQMPPEMGDFDLSMLADMVGQAAVGFTIVEGRSFVIDSVSSGSSMFTSRPLNLDLLSRVPADTPLLIQGSGFGDLVNFGFEALNMLDTFLTEEGILPIEELGPLSDLGPNELGTFIRLSIEGTYMIDLDETLAWMNGDSISILRLIMDENSPLLGLSLESAMLMATDNPDSTAQLVAAIGEMAQNAFAPVTIEDGVVTIPLGELFSMPEFLNIVVGSTDEFFVSGTANTVNYMLNPDGDSLLDSENYIYESSLFLPDAEALLYVDVAPLREIALEFIDANPQMMQMTEEERAVLEVLLGLLDTASITTATNDEGQYARLTLTLGE